MTLDDFVKPGLIEWSLVRLSLLLDCSRACTDSFVSLGLHVCVQIVDVGHHDL